MVLNTAVPIQHIRYGINHTHVPGASIENVPFLALTTMYPGDYAVQEAISGAVQIVPLQTDIHEFMILTNEGLCVGWLGLGYL